jgi:outer membrane murein-binding lipoprotein Lpp
MNPYQTSTPRAPLVIAAIALTALTLGASVIAPAKMDSGSTDVRTLAAPKSVTPTPTEVAINPARIEVVAAREPGFISVHVRNVPAKRKQQS